MTKCKLTSTNGARWIAALGAATLVSLALLGVNATTVWADEYSAGHGPAANDGTGEEWRYATYYIFPLTRHMDESEIPKSVQLPLYLVTVPLDVVQLPVGAIIGLFGD